MPSRARCDGRRWAVGGGRCGRVCRPDAVSQSVWRRFRTQLRDKMLEELVELRVARTVQDTLRAEFSGVRAEFSKVRAEFSGVHAEFSKVRAEFSATNSKIEATNTKIDESGRALSNNFRQAMKDREVRSVLRPCAPGLSCASRGPCS